MNGNDNLKLLIGLILGALIGILITFYFLDYLPLTTTFLIHALITFFILSVVLLLIYTIYRNKIIYRLFGENYVKSQHKEFSTEYRTSINSLTDSVLKKLSIDDHENSSRILISILNTVFWVITRNWAIRTITAIFITIGGLLGTILLFNQNTLIKKQNERIDIQNNLLESERKGSLVFLLDNVFDKIDEQIRDQEKISSSGKFALSLPLINRIAALCSNFKPYRIMISDTLSNYLVSPERGQMLLVLAGNNLDSISRRRINTSCDFSNAQLDNSNLTTVDLSYSKFWEARISNSNLSKSSLVHTQLMWSQLDGCFIDSAVAIGSVFEGASLVSCKLVGTDFTGASFYDANLNSANFEGAILKDANLENALIWNTKFIGADVEGANFYGIDSWATNFLNIKNLTVEQLLSAKRIYKSKNLPQSILETLETKKPCLLTENGCKVEEKELAPYEF